MRFMSRAAGVLLLLMSIVVVPAAQAAQEKVYAVLPFAVNGPADYQYLSKGLQDMLSSRLYWKDRARPITKLPGNLPPAKDMTDQKAQGLIGQLKVDYLVWGSVTVMGRDASIDLRVVDSKGGSWPQGGTVKLDNLIPSLESLARKVSAEAFGRSSGGGGAAPAASGGGRAKEQVNAMNPALVHNEADQSKEFYLNPQFRYAGDAQSEGRIRSQNLPFSAVGMVAEDFNNDGTTECIIIDDHNAYAYRFDTDNRLQRLHVYEGSPSLQNLHVSAVDITGDGQKEIIVSAVSIKKRGGAGDDYEEYEPRSYVLGFNGERLTVIKERIRLYLKAVPMPPNYEPRLLAQKEGRQKLFDKGIHEAIPSANGFDLGPRIFAPDKANVFNLGYLPQADGYKILMADAKDHIVVFTDTGERQARSDKPYFGSFVGMEEDMALEGFRDDVLLRDKYFIPMRMVAFNLDGDDRFELLVNRPISLAAQFFQRYRYFPRGEIHSLYWDGVGLNLVWKTRAIKGSVVDYGVTDVNNDGITDLYVIVNTHPGALGVAKRKAIVLVYPLDLSRTDRNIDQQFSEDGLGQMSF